MEINTAKPNKSIAQKAKNWAKKHIYARWKSWNLWMQVGVVITAFGIGMFVWYTFGDIFFKSHVDSGKYITNEDLGNLGDLLGGLCGGLFSLAGVFLLIETLRRQRVEFTKNQYVTTVQQFNDLFFHMLNLYESVLDSMGGRKFFMDNFQAIYRSFKAGNAIDIAINTYINFYDNNSTNVSHYFRVLYRIFDLIDNSFLNEDDKLKYAKIMRGQLSEAELFFIYYNAYTNYGKNFCKYINEYNLLKPLPLLNKLEFKKYAEFMQTEQIQSVNAVLYELRTDLRNFLRDGEKPREDALPYINKINVEQSSPHDLSLTIEIPIKVLNKKRVWKPIILISEKDVLLLFSDFLFDIFDFSGFTLLNNKKIQAHAVNNSTESITVKFTITNPNGEPLRLPGMKKQEEN